MAGRIVRIRPESPVEVDDLLDKCKGLAVGEHVVVTVYMTLDPPRNKPCPFCDSRKKWKKCRCSEEGFYQLTFYPEGYKRPTKSRARSGLAALMVMAMAQGWLDRGRD